MHSWLRLKNWLINHTVLPRNVCVPACVWPSDTLNWTAQQRDRTLFKDYCLLSVKVFTKRVQQVRLARHKKMKWSQNRQQLRRKSTFKQVFLKLLFIRLTCCAHFHMLEFIGLCPMIPLSNHIHESFVQSHSNTFKALQPVGTVKLTRYSRTEVYKLHLLLTIPASIENFQCVWL